MKVARKVLELTLCLIRTEKYPSRECRESYQRGSSRGAISKYHCYTDNPTVEEVSQSNEEQDQLDSISCR